MSKFAKSVLVAASRSLPAGFRHFLFKLALKCAPDQFEWYSYLYANAPNQEFVLRALAERGFSPRTIVDVGAYEGQWSMMVRSIWPNAAISMIEPNNERKAELGAIATRLNAKLYSELLGASDGKEVEFHVMASGSSVLSERSDVPRTTEVRRLAALNSLFSELQAIDLLKIDAQGYELAILDGASEILPRIHAIVLEIALVDVNVGSPLLYDVIAYMHERDFVAFDILELHRRPADKALLQVDIMFLRKNSSFRMDNTFH